MKHANAVQVFARAVVAAGAGADPVPMTAADQDGVPGRARVGRPGKPVPTGQGTQTRDDVRTDVRQIHEMNQRGLAVDRRESRTQRRRDAFLPSRNLDDRRRVGHERCGALIFGAERDGDRGTTTREQHVDGALNCTGHQGFRHAEPAARTCGQQQPGDSGMIGRPHRADDTGPA